VIANAALSDLGRRPREALIGSLVDHHLWLPDTRGGFVIHNFDRRNGEHSEAAQARRRKSAERSRSRRRQGRDIGVTSTVTGHTHSRASVTGDVDVDVDEDV
jgi:hypothetical protein